VNLGVASHIAAAAPGGPRYDANMTPEVRRSASNGIWLCQLCGKLVDSDSPLYTVTRLQAWKAEAEEVARIELETRSPAPTGPANRLARLEGLMPELLDEMRPDFVGSSTLREVLLMRRGWSYWGNGQETLVYYYDDHPNLDDLFRILCNDGFAQDTTTGNAKKYVLSEDFADYLSGVTRP